MGEAIGKGLGFVGRDAWPKGVEVALADLLEGWAELTFDPVADLAFDLVLQDLFGADQALFDLPPSSPSSVLEGIDIEEAERPSIESVRVDITRDTEIDDHAQGGEFLNQRSRDQIGLGGGRDKGVDLRR